MKKSENGIWLKTLFVTYVVLLIWIIIFRLDFSISSIHRVREINLIPFNYENAYEGDIPLFEAALNVLIFAPLGIYLKMFDFSNTQTVSAGFFTSLAFEVCQYAFKLGSSDITDVITNTIGTALGAFLYLLMCKIIKDNVKVNKIFKAAASAVSAVMAVFFVILLLNRIK